MGHGPPFTDVVSALPATIPFVAPDAIERRSGRPLSLRLGANESLFGAAPSAVSAMRRAVEHISLYGDPESADLRAELARVHGTSVERIVVGSGIDDLIGLFVRAFVSPGTVTVASLGGYPTFAFHVLGFGGAVERVPYKGDANDLMGLSAAARRTGARVVYLANPDNPSGTWHPASKVRAFADTLPEDAVLLLDEAYVDYAPSDTALATSECNARVVRMRTFSKAHGLAGARIGYAIADASIVAAVDKFRHHFGVNRVAQAGALAALGDSEHLERVVLAVAEGRKDYETLAKSLGLKTLPSATNFVSIDVGGADQARALLALLQERGVFIRMPTAPPLDRCVRVTVAPARDRARFADIFRDAFGRVAQ